jgi:NADH-quinone oxidoreductase subunit G
MIDVCPVALTDKHLDLNRVSASLTMHTEIAQLVLENYVWMFGDEIQRVTGRKDESMK